MTHVESEAVVDGDAAAGAVEPRHGLLIERREPDGSFTCERGPFSAYRRTVAVERVGDGSGQLRVSQQVDYRLAVPLFGLLFHLPTRTHMRRIGSPRRAPWWAPPDPLDVTAAAALGALAALSVACGYLGTLLTQTVTFAAEEFGATRRAQGLALAATRADVLIALVVVALADRRGRRRVLLAATAAACLLSAAGALSPSLTGLAVTQVAAKGMTTAALVAIAILAAEELPAGSRAYGISLLAMAGGLGAGQAVLLLPVADAGPRSWRLLYLGALLWLVLVALAARHLPESRRFGMPHVEAPMAGHGRRFWLLAISGMLLALFTTPASQFQNEFLRDERGFSGARISLFTVLTGTPGAIGVVIGGRLADVRGRRLVGSVGVIGGVGLTVVMFLTSGWSLWAASLGASIIGAATIPALGVYGPELFPTSLRGRANGVISGLARIGSVVGLVLVGSLADRAGSIGPALLALSIGPALVAILVLTAFPETAHRELEELNPEDQPPPPAP